MSAATRPVFPAFGLLGLALLGAVACAGVPSDATGSEVPSAGAEGSPHAPAAAAPASGPTPPAPEGDAGPKEPVATAEPPPPDLLDDEDWLEEDWLDEGPTPAQRDPWESVNRSVHDFNQTVHQWAFDPVAGAYELVVPDLGRRAVYRFFENLGEPVAFVNHVLQLAPCDAGVTGARFLVNSTVGLAGLFDPAGRIGLGARPTDFGQTLAVYWVGSGPYLVVPVLGPSTVRDAFGGLVDVAMRPDVWLTGGWGQLMTIQAGRGLAIYDVEHERVDALRESSIDFYSALRAAYLMSRDAQVEARLEHVRGGGPEAGRVAERLGDESQGPAGDASLSGTAPAVAP